MRENPDTDLRLTTLGVCDRLILADQEVILSKSSQSVHDPAWMFTNGARNALLLVPARRVQPIPLEAVARKRYSEWHRFGPDDTGFEVDLPEAPMELIGTAEHLQYASDKAMRGGDEKGITHEYKHDFEEGALVWRGDDVLMLTEIRWDQRGILN
jgi:hypothetical protein